MAERFPDRVAGKAPNDDVLADLGDLRRDQLLDRLVGILDEALFEQTDGAVKFVEFSFHDLRGHVFWFAFHLLGINRALGFNRGGRDFIATDIERLRGGDVECDVFHKRTEAIVFRDEIGLAVYLDEDADFALQMNVGGDDTFFGGAGGFLARARNTLGTQQRFGLVEIAPGLGEGPFAIHKARVGFPAELLDELGIYFHEES